MRYHLAWIFQDEQDCAGREEGAGHFRETKL